MFCNFIEIETNIYRCTNCGMIAQTEDSYDEPPLFPCSLSLERNSDDHFIENIKNLAHRASRKECTDIQILNRHTICTSCPEFKFNSCSQCGCAITRNKEFANKLLWSDEQCPIGKWTSEP